MKQLCPHCRTRAVTRSSKEVTPLYREAYFQCLNLECGHTFVVCFEVIRTIAPSLLPRAGIHLPTVPGPARLVNRQVSHRLRVPANDQNTAANDSAPTSTERIPAADSG